MRPCQIMASNGNESLLYNRLFSLLGEKEASRIWYEYRSDQFRAKHPMPEKSQLDTNGEPSATWVLAQMGIAVPTHEALTLTAKEISEKKKTFAKNPNTTYIITAKGNTRKAYNALKAMGLPNVRMEGALYTLDAQFEELPNAAFPEYTHVSIDNAVLEHQKDMMFLNRRDGSFFTIQQQDELLGMLMYTVYERVQQTDRINVAEIMADFHGKMKQILRLYDEIIGGKKFAGVNIDAARATELKELVEDGLGQMDKILPMLSDRLSRKGITLLGGKNLDKKWYTALNEQLEQAGDALETQGRGLRDWTSVVFEVNPADTASSRLKLMMSVIPKSRFVDGKAVADIGIFGAQVFEDFNHIFAQALGTLSSVEPSFAAMIQTLRSSDSRPYFHKLADILEKAPEHIQNEFVSVMRKHNESYRLMLWSRDRDGNFKAYQAEGNRSSMIESIHTEWKERQKDAPLVHRREDGSVSVNSTLLAELQGKVRKIYALKNTDIIDKAPALLNEIFKAHGIVLPAEAINYLVHSVAKYTKGTSKEGDLKRQFSVDAQGRPNGLFSALVFAEESSGNAGLSEGNPLYENVGTVKTLISKVMPFLPRTYSISHSTVENKKVWDYILHSSVTSEVQKLKAGPAVLDQLKAHPFTRNSYLVKMWAAKPELLQQFGVGMLEGMRETADNADGVTRENMSNREQLVTALNLFANGGRATSTFISLTHADKSRSPVFYGVPKIDIINKEAVKGYFAGVIKSEYNRMEITDGPTSGQLEKGRKIFYFIPEMNFESMKDLVASGQLTQEEMNAIWDENGNLLPWDSSKTGNRMLPTITKIINMVQQRLADNMLAMMQRHGIVTQDDLMIDSFYTQKLAEKLGFRIVGKGKDAQYFLLENGVQVLKTRNFYKAIMAKVIAKDFAVNSFLFNTSLSQVFYGDPAEAYKSKSGQPVSEQLRTTMVEYEKRLAKDIAPRILPTWPVGATYKTLVMDDLVDRAPYLNNPAFNNIDATDAQEWITVEEHLDTLFYRGEISRQLHDEMVTITRTPGYYEFKKPEHLAVMLQISKPVYAGKRNAAAGVFNQDYVKSAALVLYPPMTRDHGMDHVRQVMEMNGIRRAAFASAYKVGAPKNLLKVFNDDGTVVDDLEKNLEQSVITLQRENLGIQQDRPIDEEKAKIKVVTQMDRLITAGIDHMTFRGPNGGEMSGKKLREKKENIVRQIVDHHTQELLDKIGKNPEDLYDWLIKNGVSSGVGQNNILGLSMRKNGEPLIPLAMNGAAEKFFSMALSAVRKAISFKVPGASFVQATGAGFKRMSTDADVKGINYLKSYDATKGLSTARPDASNPEVIHPAEVLVPRSYLKRFHDIPDDIDINDIPAEVLQMVMARIPNQGHNSMLPARIVGFLPDSMSDTIIVPTAITKQMGSDFDVDKLYVYTNKAIGKGIDSAKIIFGHPGIGKTHLRNNGHNDIIDFDSDYKSKINYKYGLEPGFKARNEWRKDHEELWKENIRELWAEAKKEAERTGKKLLASDMMLLKEFGNDFDKVITMPKSTFIERAKSRNDYTEGETEIWKDNLDKTIGQVDRSKVISTDKYLSDILNTEEPSDIDKLMQEYFDIHWQVLTHHEVFPQMMAPLDRMDMKNEVRKGPYTNFFDPTYQLTSFLSQKDAKAMVGKAALALTGNALFEPFNLRLGIKEKNENGEFVFRETPITISDEYGNHLDLVKLSGEGRSDYSKKDGDYDNRESRSKQENLSILLSEILDHAKHRTIDAINLNTYTFNAFATLLRLSTKSGNAISAKFPSRLVAQQIIREYSEDMARVNDTLSGEFSPNAQGSVVLALEERYRKEIEKAFPGEDVAQLEERIRKIILSPQDLLEMTTTRDKNGDFYLKQIAALRLFMQLDAAGKRIAELQSYFNQLSTGPGASIIDVMDKNEKVGNLENAELVSGIIGTTDLRKSQAGYLQQAATEATMGILGKFIPKEVLLSNLGNLRSLTNRSDLPVTVQTAMYDAVMRHQFTTAAAGILWTDERKERGRLLIGVQSLAHRVQAYRETDAGKFNYLTRILVPKFSEENTTGPHTLGFNLGETPSEEIVRGWIDLLTSSDETEKALGTDLVRYAMLFNPLLRRYIPISYLDSTGISNRMKGMEQSGYLGAGQDAFFRQFIQHNPKFAQRVEADLSNLGFNYPYPPEVFTLPFMDPSKATAVDPYTRPAPQGMTREFVNYISTYHGGQWFLYEQVGVGRYVRIDTLGGSGITEYGMNDVMTSILPQNNALGSTVSMDYEKLNPNTPKPVYKLSAQDRMGVSASLAEAGGLLSMALKSVMDVNKTEWTENDIRIYAAWNALALRSNKDFGNSFLPGNFVNEVTRFKDMTTQEIQDEIGFSWKHWGSAIAYIGSVVDPTSDTGKSGLSKALTNGMTEVQEQFKRFSENSAVPDHLRVMAKLFSVNNQVASSIIPLSVQTIQQQSKFDSTYSTNTITGGFFSSWDNVIAINTSYKGVYNTMVHEGLHAFTNLAVHASVYRDSGPEAFTALFETLVHKLAIDNSHGITTKELLYNYQELAAKLSENKTLMEAVDKMNAAYEKAKSRLGDYLKANQGSLSDTDVFDLKYGVENLYEFIAVSGTDPKFMQFLNSIEHMEGETPMTLFQRIASIFEEFMTAIAKAMGIDVKKDSLLYEAMKRSFQIQNEMALYSGSDPLISSQDPTGGPGIIVTPGTINFSQEQSEAISNIARFAAGNFVNKPDALKDRTYVLSGAGGTGKTTVLKKTLEVLRAQGLSPAVFTTSHAARLVSKNAIEERVFTIHAGLMVRPDIKKSAMSVDGKPVFSRAVNNYTEVPFDKRSDAFTAMVESDVIIVDESSMLPDQFYKWIHEANPNATVILVGDYAQLPAVGEEETDLFATMFHQHPHKSVLTRNFRSSIPDVLNTIQQGRNWVNQIMENKYQGGKNAISPRPDFPAWNSENVKNIAVGNTKELMEDYYKRFSDTDILNQVLIVYTNEARTALNNMIRKKRFGDAVEAAPVKGDHMIALSEIMPTSASAAILKSATGEGKIYNGERFIYNGKQVRKIRINELGIDVEAEIMSISYPGITEPLELIHVPKIAEILNNLYKESEYRDGRRHWKTQRMKDFFKGDSMFYGAFKDLEDTLGKYRANMDFAYASTSHKSQGMEFNHVYVVETNIMDVKAASVESKARSFYTAVSRAKKSLTIYTNRPQQALPANFTTVSQSLAATFHTSGQELQLETEQERKTLLKMVNESTVLQAMPGLNNKVTINPAAKIASGGTPLEKAIQLMKDRIHEMYNSLTDLKDKAARAERLQHIGELQDQLQQLQTSQDMKLVAEAGKLQLAWVRDVVNSKSSDPNKLMTAYRLSSMWANIFELLYTDKNGTSFIPDPKLQEVMSEGQELKMTLVNGRMKQTIIDLSTVPLEGRDFGEGLQDEFAGKSLTLSLDRSKSRIAQELGVTLTDAARLRDEEMSRYLKRIMELQGEYGDVLNDLLEVTDDSIGIVGPYTQKWFDTHRELKAQKEKAIENSLKLTDRRSASSARVRAWERYRAEVLKHGTVVDIRQLVDLNTGSRVNTAEAQAERARLEAIYGQAGAEELIVRAEKKYQKYLDIQKSVFDRIDGQVTAGTMTAADAVNAKASFIARRSPVTALINILEAGTKGHKFVSWNQGETWVHIVPKPGNADFNSAKWARIQANPKAIEAHQKMHKMIGELKKMLPLHVQWQLPPNFFPYVSNMFIQESMGITEYIKTMPQRFIEDITGFESSPKDGIPVKFVTKEHGDDTANYSVKVPTVLEFFANMALHYKHMAKVKDYADMIHAEIKEINRVRNLDGEPGLTNIKNEAEFNFSNLMYRNPKEKEGKLGKIYSANPILHKRISARVTELLAKKHDLDAGFSAGTVSDIDYLDQTKEIDDELSKYEGMVMYGSRIGDKLITIAQLKALSYNPFSAWANVAFGWISAMIYGAGKVDYTQGDYLKGMNMMWGSMVKFLSFGGFESEQTEKIFNIIERMGVMGEVIETQYGKVTQKTGRSKWWDRLGPYNMMKGSDYYMKGTITLAMLLSKKVEVTETGSKKTISLFEALDKEGNWDEKRFGAAPEWYSENVEEQTEWNKFRSKVMRVNTIIMGNQDRNSPKMMNKKILGRLIGQFRLSWLPEGFAARFEDKRFDSRLGRDIKGRYRTYADLGVGGSLLTLGKQLMSIATRKDPFQDVRLKNGQPMGEEDIINMRRNLSGIIFSLGAYAAIALLKASLPDDDDETLSKEGLQALVNLFIRQKQDLMLYASPSVFDTVTRNVIPATDVITDYTKLFPATMRLLFDEDYELQQWALKVTKAGLPIPQATLLNKIKFMTDRDIDDVLK